MKKGNKEYYRAFFAGFLKLVLLIIIVFMSAGKITYWQGWVFSGINLLIFLILLIMAIKKRDIADLLAESKKLKLNTKWWEKIFWTIYLPISIALVIIAALDAGRLGITKNLHPTVYIIGYLFYALSVFIVLKAMWVNKFFSNTVRIQTDRRHEVIQSGLYRFIRHPGYAGGILLFMSQPLVLGSLLALIPASFLIVLLTIRTFIEDTLLQKELIGYTEYVKKVKYQLIPGIW